MKAAETGSTVTLSCIGTLDNGRIFLSTEEQGALVFTIGADQVFAALEQAVIGLRAGDVRNIVIPAGQAYGSRSAGNVITVLRDMFPADKEITCGQKLGIEFKGGVARTMVVTAVSGTEVTLDGNHPLAGHDLTFALRVDRID